MSYTLFVGSFGDKKLKRKIEESSIMEKDSELSLSLSLGGIYMVLESSSKSAIKSLKSIDDSVFDLKLVKKSVDKEVIESKEQQFSYKFCDKKFLNPQALGGHQNTHRRDRILSRVDKEFFMSTFELEAHSGPYSSIANHHHFYGSPLYHEGHMHPMAHMSFMPMYSIEHGYGNKGMYNTSFSAYQFGMRYNSWGTSVETPERLNYRDVGFSCELDKIPLVAGDVVTRSTTTHGDYYNRNH